MSTIGQRIASWFWRDLQLRAGFREVTDQIPDGNTIVEYWATRIDEEIGDNRFIAALEQIRDIDYRGNRHESAFIAIRALGPAKVEQAEQLGVTNLATADGVIRTEQMSFGGLPAGTTHIYGTVDEILRGEGIPVDLTVRSVNGPSRTSPVAQPPAPSPDDFL